ncbi:alpha/beta fold hydrolase [Actinoplanes philippinensis]|uniref:alpha/beta fold hydrolase n=1 Tax=Actinoplanes philippinensis TaxID=35752 RepID=UPI0034004202
MPTSAPYPAPHEPLDPQFTVAEKYASVKNTNAGCHPGVLRGATVMNPPNFSLRNTRRRRSLVAAIVVVGVFAAVAVVAALRSGSLVNAGQREPSWHSAQPASLAPPVQPALPPLPEHFTRQPLAWKACSASKPKIRCATIDAPMDYFHPQAGTIKVTFSRFATSVAAKRRGVLLFNPGGPGIEGLGSPWYWSEKLTKDVLDQYDLIGFDPRGVGRSTPIRCGLIENEALPYAPYDPATFTQQAADAKSAAGKCATTGQTTGHISTRNTARDMDLIRVLLGEEKISYFGISYGTYLGAVYTQLYPGRSDRMMLDSNVDPARMGRGFYEGRAIGSARRFTHFTEWAAQRDATYHLGPTPAAVEHTFWGLVDRLKRAPLSIDGRRFTERHARSQMADLSARETDGADFLINLRKAVNGEKNNLYAPEDPGKDDAIASPWLTIMCNDTTTWPQGQQPYLDDLARLKKLYPISWDLETGINACGFWSLHTEPDLTVSNDVPALLLQNEWDLATPREPGDGMHRALRASRLVTVKGAPEHGAYSNGNSCATDIANKYLSTGILPPADVTCPPHSDQRK